MVYTIHLRICKYLAHPTTQTTQTQQRTLQKSTHLDCRGFKYARLGQVFVQGGYKLQSGTLLAVMEHPQPLLAGPDGCQTRNTRSK